MKKVLLAVVLAFLTLPVCAQLEQGQHMLGGRLGLGFQLNNSGVMYSNQNNSVDWGTLGAEYGLSYYYIATPAVGVGAEITYGDFEGGSFDNLFSSDDAEDDTHFFSVMATARYTANPENRFRFYAPIGLGIVSAHQHLSIDTHTIHYNKKAKDSSVGWFIGVGMEGDIGNEGWSLGAEARYSAFWFDSDKLTREAPAEVKSRGTRRLDYLTFMVRLSKRF